MGIDSTATGGMFGKWQRLHTYGGKIVENACQSLAMDIMASNMLEIDKSYPIILTVHDEIISETNDNGTAEELAELMSKTPEWLPGFPLAAAGFDTDRYRKE
jgi:DNA polymerase